MKLIKIQWILGWACNKKDYYGSNINMETIFIKTENIKAMNHTILFLTCHKY